MAAPTYIPVDHLKKKGYGYASGQLSFIFTNFLHRLQLIFSSPTSQGRTLNHKEEFLPRCVSRFQLPAFCSFRVGGRARAHPRRLSARTVLGARASDLFAFADPAQRILGGFLPLLWTKRLHFTADWFKNVTRFKCEVLPGEQCSHFIGTFSFRTGLGSLACV